MADLVLSPVIDRLVECLADYLGDQYNLRSGVGRKLTDLKESLLRLQAVTTAAEEVDTNNKPLAAWRMQLKEAVYDAEDVIDEFDYRRLERQAIDAEESKVTNFFNPRKVLRKFSSSPLKKLQKIQNRLDKLAMSTGDFLQLINSEHCTRWAVSDRSRETTSFINEPIFVGRSKVMEEIINQLVEVGDGTESASRIDGEVPAVLIVGPGGFGKSTLARNVFHDQRVENLFELRMWVHVSQNFDLKRLTKAMIESISGSSGNVESLDRLQQDLKKAVGSRKFLLVLDDMWCGQDMLKMEEDWRCLLAPLAGGRGSAILLTTRTEELKVLPGTYPPLVLNPLEDDECWSIICANTFCNGEIPDGHEHLVEIGKKIAVKLKGSPIAAKAISGVLRNNLEYGYWNRILETGIGELQDVMDVLRLSYRHLPPHLRQCFAYCSLFPKGFTFYSRVKIEDIGRMWFAQGFIRPKDGESVDEAGRRCFNDLLSRSFFQKLHGGYVMHDLMNDLARQVSQGDCLRFEEESLPEGKIPETVRHLCITTKDHLTQLKIRGCNRRNLRSILVLPGCDLNGDTLPKRLHRVRVLHVSCRNVRLPDDVGDWIHLRYLSLFYCYWTEPQSFYRLYHLQVLAIRINTDTVARNFERKVSNLTNLRVLALNGVPSGFHGITDMGSLTNLEVFSCPFYVTRDSGCNIGQLKTLDKLGPRLDVWNLENIESKEEAEAANLQSKRLLEVLFLRWGHHSTRRDIPSLSKDVEVFEALQPPSNLKELMIEGFDGSECPSWMHNNWLSNLSVVTLHSLGMLVQLPRLGELPRLKTLRLQCLYSMTKIGGHDFYGEKATSFPSLKELLIEDMALLEEWSRPEGDGLCFPNLEDLRIKNCPRLSSLPWVTGSQEDGSLPPSSLKILDIYECDVIACDIFCSPCLQGFPNLSFLRIHKHISLLQTGLMRALVQVFILDCEAFTPIGLEGVLSLGTLKRLAIRGCPGLFAETSSPTPMYLTESNFSSSLEILVIDELLLLTTAPILKTVSSLGELYVTGSFEGACFPAEVEDFLHQNCCTLSYLTLSSTPFLRSLPANLECMSSLRELEIYDAPELQSLPVLPHSLTWLTITGVNEGFRATYEKEVVPDWLKVQHVENFYMSPEPHSLPSHFYELW